MIRTDLRTAQSDEQTATGACVIMKGAFFSSKGGLGCCSSIGSGPANDTRRDVVGITGYLPTMLTVG